MANKNYTSFFPVYTVEGTNGKKTRVAAATGILVRPDFRTVNFNGEQRLFCRASMPVSNRTKTINAVMGTSFDESQETVWLDVEFWSKAAERLEKFLNAIDNSADGNPKPRLVVFGTLSLNKWTKRDGTDGETVKMTVMDWTAMPKNSNSDGNNAQTAPTTSSNATGSAPEPTFKDGFIDLDDTEDDLPF